MWTIPIFLRFDNVVFPPQDDGLLMGVGGVGGGHGSLHEGVSFLESVRARKTKCSFRVTGTKLTFMQHLGGKS